jgi:hypothetical protein
MLGGQLNILTVNLLFSTLIFWMVAKLYLLPKLPRLAPCTVLVPILVLHSFRHLGLMFLAKGATYPGVPEAFARPAAYGDVVAALLALASIPAVVRNASGARSLVWVFNLVGSVDLALAIALATITNAADFMGPAYWIPAFWVPALIVTHGITFQLLRRNWTTAPA